MTPRQTKFVLHTQTLAAYGQVLHCALAKRRCFSLKCTPEMGRILATLDPIRTFDVRIRLQLAVLKFEVLEIRLLDYTCTIYKKTSSLRTSTRTPPPQTIDVNVRRHRSPKSNASQSLLPCLHDEKWIRGILAQVQHRYVIPRGRVVKISSHEP